MTTEYMQLLLQDMSIGFFMKQVLVIVGLFLLGFLFLQLSSERMEPRWKYLLAFPIGLALWCIVGFLILTLGISFSVMTMLIGIAIGLVIFMCFQHMKNRANRAIDSGAGTWKMFLTVVCIAFVTACIATSGLLSLSVSNDSMYYYLYYPEVLTINGGYAASFDTFLSDVGPMAAIIGTLPSMFGFDQIYGIHQFFNFNFISIFAFVIYEKAGKDLSQRASIVVTLFGTILLFTSTPYLVVSKWVMANAYVMYYSFILFFLAYKYNPSEFERDGNQDRFPAVLCVLIAMISMLRMEGCVVACLIIVCMSALRYSNKELIYSVMMPTLLLPSLYYVRYFFVLKVSPLYSFLTWQKALLIVCAMLVLLLYLACIRGRCFKRLQNRMGWLILSALLIGNAMLLAVSPSHYLGNLRTFLENIDGRQGWGYTVELMIICYIVIYIISHILTGYRLQHRDIAYEDLIFMGYLLVTIAVSYARGSGLRYGIGDSGNRVMLQIIPLAWYALICKAINLMKEFRDANHSKCR